MQATDVQDGGTGGLRSVGEWALKVLSVFVILEPVWMLLPFAGFLYGSVLRIETLNRNPGTAWLTHFVFPVLTGGWLGPILTVVGFGVFLVGAGQIYTAKWRKTGLVTNGLYRSVRNPQYISLTLFGVGILLAWGRAITYIAFFVMMFFYYYLSRSEERNCRRLFGEAYEAYRERTSFILPGDRHLRPLGVKLSGLNLPAPIRLLSAFALAMLLCFGSMSLINAVKTRTAHVPYLSTTVTFDAVPPSAPRPGMTASVAGGIPFVEAGRLAVVRGPHSNARAPGFAGRLVRRLPESEKLAGFLSFLDDSSTDVAIVFCGSYEGGRKGAGSERVREDPSARGSKPDRGSTGRVRLLLLRASLAPGASVADALADTSKRELRGGCVALVDLDLPEGRDIVEADGRTRGPGFPAEERWDYFAAQFTALPGFGLDGEQAAAAPGDWRSAQLALVRAPILRTRLDPAFAEEIRDRLAGSDRFRTHLRNAGAGGDVVAVGFPRPGPNWYREYHGDPQVSVMVMLVRLADSGRLEDIFLADGRKLLGAFIADVDFKIPASEDSVAQLTSIGPRRDLEQRWDFLLSGIGGGIRRHAH